MFDFILVAGLSVLGVLTRFLPHAPNFSPILAVIIFSVVVTRNRWVGVAIPIIAVLVSDLVLGFYPGIEFVYLAYALTAATSLLISQPRPGLGVVNAGLGGTFLFFVLSNLGVWYATGLYAKTTAGLMQCYIMALPFYYQTLASTLLGLVVLFGAYRLASRLVTQWRPHGGNA